MTLDFELKQELFKIEDFISGKKTRGKSFNQRYEQLNEILENINKKRTTKLFLDKDELRTIEDYIVNIKQRENTYLGSRMRYDNDLKNIVEGTVKKLQYFRNQHYSLDLNRKEETTYFTELNNILKGKEKGIRTYAERFSAIEEKLDKYDKYKADINHIDEFRNILASLENNTYLNKKIAFIEQLEKEGKISEYMSTLSDTKRKYFKRDLNLKEQKEYIKQRILNHEDHIQKLIKPLIVNKKIEYEPLDEIIKKEKERKPAIEQQPILGNQKIKLKTQETEKSHYNQNPTTKTQEPEPHNLNPTYDPSQFIYAAKHEIYKRPAYLDTIHFPKVELHYKTNFIGRIKEKFHTFYEKRLQPVFATFL